jgi:hypothetical protein
MAVGPTRIEHALVFDYAASWLAHVRPPLLAVVSTPEFADLVLARASGGLTLAADNEATRQHVERRLRDGTLPAAVAEPSRVLPWGGRLPAGAFDAAMWAGPRPATWGTTLSALGALLVPGAPLCILSGTAWGGLIRPLRARSSAADPASLARRVRARLTAAGWTISQARAFGGAAGVGWAGATRLAGQLTRPDLADRAEHAYRQAAESGHGAAYELLLVCRGPAT